MQPLSPKEALIVRASNLSKSAPDQWRSFMEALAVYNEVHRENLVKSPLAELPVNQGRAQVLSSFLAMLSDCDQSAEKIRSQKNG